MWTVLYEWGALLLRWTHIVAGIAWIGSSFYFMHLDAAIKPVGEIPKGKGGEAWEVHGGGFYQVRKYLVAPSRLPEELIWHKWQAYVTWISGFSLLVWIYYLGADLFLVNPSVMRALRASGGGDWRRLARARLGSLRSASFGPRWRRTKWRLPASASSSSCHGLYLPAHVSPAAARSSTPAL